MARAVSERDGAPGLPEASTFRAGDPRKPQDALRVAQVAAREAEAANHRIDRLTRVLDRIFTLLGLLLFAGAIAVIVSIHLIR